MKKEKKKGKGKEKEGGRQEGRREKRNSFGLSNYNLEVYLPFNI